MAVAKKVSPTASAKPAAFSGEKERDRRVRAMVGALVALAFIAAFLAGILVAGLSGRPLAVQPDPVINVFVEATLVLPAAEVALPTADAAIVVEVEANCPEGTSQIPEWAPGLCGDEAFLALAAGQPQGEIDGPGTGVLVILSENVEDHCYGDEATFWPLTVGVNGSIPVARDYPAMVEFPEGRWGLGGATECTP